MTNELDKKQKQELDKALFKRLQQLFLKIPKDPSLYSQQVAIHTLQFKEQFTKLIEDTQRKSQRFGELAVFLAKCHRYYQKSLEFFIPCIMDLLNNYGSILHPYNRRKAVGCIFILRAKNSLFPVSTVQFLIKLFNMEDKPLRKAIYQYLVNDIRRMNKHSKNQKINNGIMSFIQSYIKNHSDKAAQKSIKLMVDLYKRNIWTDNRAVNIIANGCLNSSPKIRLLSAYFLIQTTQTLHQLEESSDQQPPPTKSRKGVAKDTKNRQKTMQKEKKKAARKRRKKEMIVQNTHHMPIDVLYSPQDFCEKLFDIMSRKEEKFNHRLVMMALIARMIWRHKLIILPFYGYLMKYMQPHQKQVHRVLAAFAEAVHEIVPDDDLEGVIKHIVQKFVNDKCSEFAMTIGLNTIRQVANKVPSLLTEDLMLYLCTYYDYKNKNVSMAAKSLINLVRKINPDILQKKYRGKPGEHGQIQKKQDVSYRIDGAHLLGSNGQIPIEMDRILTDEDFKMIRKLKRKQAQKQLWGQLQQNNNAKQQQIQMQQMQEQDGSQPSQDQDDQQGSEEQLQFDDVHAQEYDQQGDEQEEIEIDEQDESEGEGDDEGEGESEEQIGQENQNDNQQQSQEGQDLQEFEQLDWDNLEEIQQQKPKSKNKNKNINNSNNKNKKNQQQSSESDQQSEQSDDENGFIPMDRIAFYKKNKSQVKAEKRNNKGQKQKFKHKPKQKKGGGTTNKQKQRSKPLFMLRAKKNKQKMRQKQVKSRIKDLKNQLGRVRSGKEAKKRRNKKVKTN